MTTDEKDGAGMSTESKVEEFKIMLGDRYNTYHPHEIPCFEEEEIFQKFDDCYDMKTFPRGRLLVINMKDFTYKSGLQNVQLGLSLVFLLIII